MIFATYQQVGRKWHWKCFSLSETNCEDRYLSILREGQNAIVVMVEGEKILQPIMSTQEILLYTRIPPIPEGYEILPFQKGQSLLADDLVLMAITRDWRHVPNRVGLVIPSKTTVVRKLKPKTLGQKIIDMLRN